MNKPCGRVDDLDAARLLRQSPCVVELMNRIVIGFVDDCQQLGGMLGFNVVVSNRCDFLPLVPPKKSDMTVRQSSSMQVQPGKCSPDDFNSSARSHMTGAPREAGRLATADESIEGASRRGGFSVRRCAPAH